MGVAITCGAFAVATPNPRSGGANVRTDGRNGANNSTVVSDTARSVVSPRRTNGIITGAANKSRAMVSRSAARSTTSTPKAINTARSTTTVARTGGRSAISQPARSATMVSRAGVSRATAIFSDISKIGGGYAACRDAYATCMDQLCANANDTYRRCYCSARFAEFRDTENAIDQAQTLLMQFEDNNLNAVDKTADEVNAMYTATVGEMAIKRDTSAAQSVLNEIGDLLSGKKRASQPTPQTVTLLGAVSVDLTTDLDDIWSGNDSNSVFATTNNGVDLTTLDGIELYQAAHNQCSAIVRDSCNTSALFNMAQSSYGILISQDCNAYQKKIDAQMENVKQTVRTAEKYLREARLDEYRAHNSADVNACLSRVRDAMLADTACGANYKRCLDYTGVYINQTTGDANMSPRFFELQDLIKLDGASSNGDVLTQNSQFNNFLESRKMFAASALDTCRDLADTVWSEFKRTALIEIAQAQDDKIEEVKMSCVSTMKECYDTQTKALKSFDNTTAQTTGALAAYTARQMCADRVIMCASLYGDTSGCRFDGNGVLTAGNNTDPTSGAARCGLTSLLNFVDSVDDTRISEGCETAIDNYLKDLCTPQSGGSYPYNCRNLSLEVLETNVDTFVSQNCALNGVDLARGVQTKKNRAISDLGDAMDMQLGGICEDAGGYWIDDPQSTDTTALLTQFYAAVFGGRQGEAQTSWGRCVQNTTKLRCEDYNDSDKGTVATYNASTDECEFTAEWYAAKCTLMGGYYENSVCYVAN